MGYDAVREKDKDLRNSVIETMKYTYEFKRQVVDDFLAGKGGVQALARTYGVGSKSQVRQWIVAFREYGDDGLRVRRKKEQYSAAFKEQAVKSYLDSGKSLGNVAPELGIKNPGTLNRWVREYAACGTALWKS